MASCSATVAFMARERARIGRLNPRPSMATPQPSRPFSPSIAASPAPITSLIRTPLSRPTKRVSISNGRLIFVSTLDQVGLGLRDAAAIPATSAIAETDPAVIGDSDRVLQFDEAASWMFQRRLDGNDHAGFQRPVDVIGGIGVCAPSGQARRFVTDQPHAMGDEFD